jgi:hypothetical protein
LFDEIGLVYLTNTGLSHLADMRRAATLVMENEMRYEAGANPQNDLVPNVSAYEYYPPLDRNLLYSSVADDSMWFDTWPRVQHLPYDQRPAEHSSQRRRTA